MKKLLIVLTCLFFLGCASDEAIKKPTQSPPKLPVVQVPSTVVKPVVAPVVKETKDVFHFVTFRSEPSGAGIYVIDSQTGKEVGFLGTTPVRILLLKKKVEIDGFYTNWTDITPNATGLALTGKTGKVEQVEFQFKYKLQGFYDEIKIERLPLNTISDTDAVTSINLMPVKK